jgi:hypothetical protein
VALAMLMTILMIKKMASLQRYFLMMEILKPLVDSVNWENKWA